MLKICACLNPQAYVRHQDILFFLNKTVLTELVVLLASHLRHHITATISKWCGLFSGFAFQLFSSHVFASPPCSSLIISYLRFRYFHWKPFTLVAFVFRWLSGEFSSSFHAVFRCSLCSPLWFCPVLNKTTRATRSAVTGFQTTWGFEIYFMQLLSSVWGDLGFCFPSCFAFNHIYVLGMW